MKPPMEALLAAAERAIETYDWIIGDHPKLDPDGCLPLERAAIREAIDRAGRAQSELTDAMQFVEQQLRDLGRPGGIGEDAGRSLSHLALMLRRALDRWERGAV